MRFVSDPSNSSSVNSNHPLQPFIVTANSKSSTPIENNSGKKKESVKVKATPPLTTYLNSTDRMKRRKKMDWARGFLRKRVVNFLIGFLIYSINVI